MLCLWFASSVLLEIRKMLVIGFDLHEKELSRAVADT